MTMFENNQTNSKNSKGRGGARKNAGRKAGAATKRTREIADKAAEEGITPLEVMLSNMRFAHLEASGILEKLLASDAEKPNGFDSLKELMRYRAMAQEAAKDAAPYVHPRLAAIEHSGEIKTRSLAEELAELNGSQRNPEGRPPVA
jgi:hypothetical protein